MVAKGSKIHKKKGRAVADPAFGAHPSNVTNRFIFGNSGDIILICLFDWVLALVFSSEACGSVPSLGRKKFAAGGYPAASHDGGAPEPRLLLFAPWSDPSALVFTRQQKSMVSPELPVQGNLLRIDKPLQPCLDA
jgi:hypothetical protein